MTKHQKLDINYHALVDIRRRIEQLRPEDIDDVELRDIVTEAKHRFDKLEDIVMREIEMLEKELNINEQ